MRKISVLFLALTCYGCAFNPDKAVKEEKVNVSIQAPYTISARDNANARYEYEMNLVKDPKTGKLPPNVRRRELDFAAKLSRQTNFRKTEVFQEEWELIGPYNVGGRTRALALDIDDENTILAGGVSGGLWKSSDAGLSWTRTSSPTAVNSISTIVQDHSEGQYDVWYFGTGELNGNSAREVGAPYRGNGIYKSTDNGDSWEVLPATATAIEGNFNNAFSYSWNLAINEDGDGEGDLYAAIFGGIVRSQDGGSTWETVLGEDLINEEVDDLNEPVAPFFTNVMITDGGMFYAAMSSTTTSFAESYDPAGIYFSQDGEEWNRLVFPRGFMPVSFDRVVFDYVKSNERELYCYIAQNALNYLYKFEISEDFSSAQGTNLTPNIPDSLVSQSSYNMVVKVHPDQDNIVYLGGTNLYRSTDGFQTPDNIVHIGGYSPADNVTPYTNHHPDQHEIVFYPSDANKMLTANDGGIRLTNNNVQEDTASWININNGYVTSQFYSVAISKEENSEMVFGGLQDNGTYFKSTNNTFERWSQIVGGDGGYAYSTSTDRVWYISYQESNIFKIRLDESNRMTSFAQVTPADGVGFLFINPYVLDPNNYNKMYLAGGNVVWRNDNLNQIPEGVQEPTDINWTEMTSTASPGQLVTALAMSTEPSDILYYGSQFGDVYRVDNASDDSSTPRLLNNPVFGGYVSSISVDPTDADHVMFTYSNYNIHSVFVTRDGGVTVEPVGGNLEEDETGEGIGPSARACKIIPLNDGAYLYGLGTSVGFYTTTELDGANTVWTQEGASTIGNSVVVQIDYRPVDGAIVVATHGNGIFKSAIGNTRDIESVDEQTALVVQSAAPNPFVDEIDIQMSLPEEGNVYVSYYTGTGQLIRREGPYFQFKGDFSIRWDGTDSAGKKVPAGVYVIRLQYQGQIKNVKVVYHG